MFLMLEKQIGGNGSLFSTGVDSFSCGNLLLSVLSRVVTVELLMRAHTRQTIFL